MIFPESIRKHLPQYLSTESTKELLKELEAFSSVGTTVAIYSNTPFSNMGFYLFLLKISINFTRIQEKVDRAFTSNFKNN